MTKTDKKRKLPDFDKMSYGEEARWWETHTIADYPGEFEVVETRFAKNLSETMNIRFDPITLNRLRRIAHKRGIGPTTLARMWVLEKLHALEEKVTYRPNK